MEMMLYKYTQFQMRTLELVKTIYESFKKYIDSFKLTIITGFDWSTFTKNSK